MKNVSLHLFPLYGCRKFQPGISVRTIQSCVEQAATDLTVATTLIEAR